jgi:hypothetical protein
VLLSSAVSQHDAGDAAMVRAQLRNLAGIDDTHIVPGSQLVSHVLLKEWATLEQGFGGTRNGRHPDAELIPVYIFQTYQNRTVLGKVTKEVRKVLPHDDRSTRKQPMHMSSLWYPFARLGIIGQSIAFDHGDLFKMIREDTSGQQSGHTSANYDGMVPVERALRWLFATHDCPPSVQLSGSIT